MTTPPTTRRVFSPAVRLLLTAALAVGGLSLGACSFKEPWWGLFNFAKPTVKKVGQRDIVTASPFGKDDPRRRGGQNLSAKNNPKVQLLKLTLPAGAFSGNDKVWRQLDEDALDSETSILLAHNGIRAAVGPQARWGALQKLIDVPGAASEGFILETDGRSSINITTRPNVAEQLVNYIDGDKLPHLRSYDKCDNAVRLSLNRMRDLPDLLIQMEPVVQLGTVTLTRSPDEMGVVRTSSRQEETFANLRLAAPVKPTNFLVLAPANGRDSTFSVGTRFLTDAEKVPPVETILIFTPINEPAKK